jgi:hypothetical protein
MTLVRCYLYREQVVLPTVKETAAGFYVDSQPVRICALKDRQSLRHELVQTLEESNEVVPTPASNQEAGSVILDKLGLQKWSSFEKSAVMYTVLLGVRYTTIYASGRGSDGMWSEPESKQRFFDPHLSTEAIVDLLIEDMSTRPEARSERFSLAVVPKPQ